jgi:hypothetical protein
MAVIRYYPTDRQVCLAVALAIQSHPLIQNPPVFNPATPVGAEPEQIFVRKFRTYAGLELPEQGLTVSVYPTGGTTNEARNAIEHEHYTLGRPEPGEYLDRLKFRVSIEALLTESSFDIPVQVQYYLVPNTKLPQGYNVSHIETITQNDLLESNQSVELYIVPAEEILRDYMTLLRMVIKDQQVFLPYGLRNPSILYTNYPSSNTISQTESQNLLFHRAHIAVEFDIYQTNQARDLDEFYYVEFIKILDTYKNPDLDVEDTNNYETLIGPEAILHTTQSYISAITSLRDPVRLYHRTLSSLAITASIS